jgi:hypothetical protein
MSTLQVLLLFALSLLRPLHACFSLERRFNGIARIGEQNGDDIRQVAIIFNQKNS